MKNTIEFQREVPAQQRRRPIEPNQADTPSIPPGRQPNGNGLLSLAEFEDGQSLQGALASHVQKNRGDALVQAAVDLITALDDTDKIADAESNVLQTAVQILLTEKQGALLCRLAEKRPDRVFNLHIGNSPALAQVVIDIGAKWPPQAPVEIALSTELPAASIRALHPFLQRPRSLALSVGVTVTPDIKTFSAAVRLRKLEGLTITGSAPALAFLQSLVGARAKRLQLNVQQSQDALAGEVASAMSALVKQSDATELHLGNCAIAGHPSAGLVVGDRRWEKLVLPITPNICALLGQRQHTIDRLELQMAQDTPQAALECMQLVASAEFMQMLHVCCVGQLVVDGPVNLVQWVEAMDHFTSSHQIGRLLESLKAGFVVVDGADMEGALASLVRHRRIAAVFSLPLRTAVQGHSALDSTAQSRLAFINEANRMALHHARMQVAQAAAAQAAAIEQAQALAVISLELLLAPGITLQRVVDFLKAPGNILIKPTIVDTTGLDLTSTSVLEKLRVFKSAKVDLDIVKPAVVTRLRVHPQELEDIVQALLRTQILPSQGTLKTWQKLGATFRKQWVLDSRAPASDVQYLYDAFSARVPVAQASAVQLPVVGDARWALAEPGTSEGYAALVQRLQNRVNDVQATLDANPQGATYDDDVHKRDALTLLHQFLLTGALDLNHMTPDVCCHIGDELLLAEQGKLLRHLVPAGLAWQLNVISDARAKALADATPWPEPQRQCVVALNPKLSTASLAHVVKFTGSVAADKLTVTAPLGLPAAPHFPDALVDVIESSPGLALGLNGSGGKPTLGEGWMPFFKRDQKLPIGTIRLMSILNIQEPLPTALVDMIRRSGVPAASVHFCSDALTQAVVACHSWESLHLSTSPALAQQFVKAPVSTKALHLLLLGQDAQQCAEEMMGSCKGLVTVEVNGAQIGVVPLFRGLNRSRSAMSVRFEPAPASAQEERVALALLQRNPWLVDLFARRSPERALQPHPLSEGFRWRTSALVNRNLFRESEWFRRGAGIGFSTSLPTALAADVGSQIGNHLDLPSARALSLTNKASYTASQEVWRTEIERLTDQLAPSVGIGAFVAAVNQRRRDWQLHGAVLSVPDDQSGDPVMLKIDLLRKAGLTDSVIGLMLSRMLSRVLSQPDTPSASKASGDERAAAAAATKGRTLRALLQGLTCVRAIPAKTWLREGMGIDLSNNTGFHS
ncbi:hypothetical protein [Hydrogenophaga sp.]|uniref:hypothetical protein n=1 Tax=Hydrogenophaga sp. TaxID=1904254 RepID=UPI00271687F5|nr:hypothetical protein [Hydrogenophaga sp.]MDO9437192.1 hypothetical protein [Hydrogenophaga sp.]